MRFVTGGLAAGTPAEDSRSTYWIRDSPPRALDHSALTALADSFFPRVFLRRGSYMPAGTISLTVYYHATAQELAAHREDFVLATARAAHFGNGHFDQHGQLFNGDRALLATTHQLVYFKDPH
jgi:acyl-CoA thioesterase